MQTEWIHKTSKRRFLRLLTAQEQIYLLPTETATIAQAKISPCYLQLCHHFLLPSGKTKLPHLLILPNLQILHFSHLHSIDRLEAITHVDSLLEWASRINCHYDSRSIGELQRKPEPSRGDVDNNITMLLAKSSPLRMFCAAFMIAHFRLICPDAASICMLLTQPLLS